MPKTSSEQSDEAELESLQGVSVSAFAFDPDEAEWYIVFSNGRRLTLSAMGDVAYYHLSEVLH